MAQTDALSIFQSNGTDKDKLAESYAALIDQIQKAALSIAIKATGGQLSGDPTSGSIVVRRLMTSVVKALGTARTAGEGDTINNNGITVNLDTDKEIVEEVSKFDLKLYGLPSIIDRRRSNFAMAFARYLDSAFFAQAISAGDEVDVSGATGIAAKVEALIQSLETVSNDNVDGVDREMMILTLTPEAYGALETAIDNLPNPANGGVKTNYFHRVQVESNHRQTEDALVQVKGSVAQPVSIVDFAVGDIPLSPNTAMQLFFKLGTKAIMPDLIKYATVVEEVSA